jgi:16S rRNA A1518/A1519 N6-dimethyltransferase RsmA/KsgA/DIM1 with predicted DNA glycosylase/AP lyase activity
MPRPSQRSLSGEALAAADVNPTRRVEMLSVEEILRLANTL